MRIGGSFCILYEKNSIVCVSRSILHERIYIYLHTNLYGNFGTRVNCARADSICDLYNYWKVSASELEIRNNLEITGCLNVIKIAWILRRQTPSLYENTVRLWCRYLLLFFSFCFFENPHATTRESKNEKLKKLQNQFPRENWGKKTRQQFREITRHSVVVSFRVITILIKKVITSIKERMELSMLVQWWGYKRATRLLKIAFWLLCR